MTFLLVRRLATKRELHPYNLKEDTQSKLSDEKKDNLTKIIAQKDAQKSQQQAQIKDANIGRIVQVCFFFNFYMSYLIDYKNIKSFLGCRCRR